MAVRPFLGEGLPEAERNELLRRGEFDRDLFRAVYSRNWRRKYNAAEVERMKQLKTQEMGNGYTFSGDLWSFYNFLRDRAVIEYWDRQLRTGENLVDPVGTLFYGVADATDSDVDKASDLGAKIGSAASAGFGGPRYGPQAPTYQRNQAAQTSGGRGPPAASNPPQFVVTPRPPSQPAKGALPPVVSSTPAQPVAPVPSGRPEPAQQSIQRPPNTTPTGPATANRIEAPAPPKSKGTKVPESPRTGEQDPLQIKKPVGPASVKPSPAPVAAAEPPGERKVFTQPAKGAKVAATPKKPEPAKPAKSAAKKKKAAERTPPPHVVEKGTVEAIERDVPRMPEGSRVVSRGQNFNTIAGELEAIRKASPENPKLKPLDKMDKEVLNDSSWELLDRQARAGRGELKQSYESLYKVGELRAKRGDPALKEELLNFMKAGRLGARKPDSLVLVDEPKSLNFVMTDPTIKERLIPSMVHEFKSLFNREGMHALMGNNPDVKVESWEHNPKLGIHRDAQVFKKR
jgi:hypothetical protein